MDWNIPKDIHTVYEALSAIADGRIQLKSDTLAHVYSTSGNKYYIVEYNSEKKEIMSNDNKAFYVNEVSYPMVAMILLKDEIKYDKSILEYLKDIKWKDINKRNKNDYMKSVKEVLENIKNEGKDTTLIEKEIERIYNEVCSMNLKQLGKKRFPPSAY